MPLCYNNGKEMIRPKFLLRALVVSSTAGALLLSAGLANAAEGLPGTIEGVGNHFQVTDSSYLNITLDSSVTVDLTIQSVLHMVVMDIQVDQSGNASSQFTISGFLPNTTYYKYQDDYHNLDEFVTDSNGSYTYTQDISAAHHVFIQPTHSTKFIKDNAVGGNCLDIGTWDSVNKICTLTQNVSETIQIDDDGITLDGNNFIVSGFHTGYGVLLNHRSGVTVKNLQVKNFSAGIGLESSNTNTITSNTVSSNDSRGIDASFSNSNNIVGNVLSNNLSGIGVFFSSGNSLSNNLVSNSSANGTSGIIIINSSGTLMSGNIISGNENNFQLSGSTDDHFNHSIDNTNLVDGKPIYYIKNAVGQTYDSSTNAGVFFCVNCSHVTVKDLDLAKNAIGITFYKTNDSNIENVTSHDNFFYGAFLRSSNGNEVTGGTFSNNEIGILLLSSDTNLITNNNVTFNNKHAGVGGIDVADSDNNQIYNNNLIDNFSDQITVGSSVGNIFNLPAPIGGNYYDNFDTPTEGCFNTNSDNFCDSPYMFTGGQDNLPWVRPIVAEKTLSEKAADLAKLVINAPYLGDGVTFGGKGWDYNLGGFVAPSAIKTDGYHFWNNALNSGLGGVGFGAGLDCSGLIMWAYNRSFNPATSFLDNFVTKEGANEQYYRNTEPIIGLEPESGDAIFFDWGKWHEDTQLWDGIKDEHIDHVAMYVGESGGFDVVSAASRTLGIVARSKDTLRQLAGFVAFKQVVQGPLPKVLASSYSPVNLIVTDPDGYTITPTTTVPSDEEYLREISGVLYYSEMERGTDGRPIDRVYSPVIKTGDYTIKVVPDGTATTTSTYTLDFSVEGGQPVILANNIPISQIPSQGYGVTTSATGTLNSFIPVLIDIKPGSYPNSINLGSNGVVPVAIFGSATLDVHQIDPTTIKLANTSVNLKGNGQPMASYSDVNGDGFTDIVVQVSTQALQLTANDVKANLEGQLTGGTLIKGPDSVRIVP